MQTTTWKRNTKRRPKPEIGERIMVSWYAGDRTVSGRGIVQKLGKRNALVILDGFAESFDGAVVIPDGERVWVPYRGCIAITWKE